MAINGMRPVHPGEVLREEFLEPLGITPAALARALHVSAPTINDIVRERRGVTADTAIRLGRYFDTSAQFWMNLQSDYALATTYAANGEEIENEIEPLRAVG
ncbi:HigA family addiction module antitoxin [Stutzerimonas nitrititolerans]|uniref:HigA family addiction module antitoxin n=1 Tax=Stutzerimonas nitrititolerans TaxID=2482751 RepID=A0AA42BCT6_9GAMM|nr:HigA family addiction module antitoxin [Stutzerimonas nitrititolerans]MCO7544691.1 HigA family addiction module antitoxin [Stutzerimonas nitrititolerans]